MVRGREHALLVGKGAESALEGVRAWIATPDR
jgi:hypothetical protein